MKTPRIILFASLAINLGLAASTAVLLVKYTSLATAFRTQISAPERIFGIVRETAYTTRVTEFKATKYPPNGVVVLGDSLTQLGPWQSLEAYGPIINMGISGDTTAGLMSRLDQVIGTSPRAIFVLAGLNDLFWGGDIPTIVERYSEIVDRLRTALPQTTIIAEGIPPVTDGLNEHLTNDRVAALNSELALLAKEKGLTFIDIGRDMRSPDGNVLPSFTEDGIHLSEEGKSHWSQIIKPYFEKL